MSYKQTMILVNDTGKWVFGARLILAINMYLFAHVASFIQFKSEKTVD